MIAGPLGGGNDRVGRRTEDDPNLVVTYPPLPFDTTQITSKSNYSRPKPGDPCHPLGFSAHPPAIAAGMRVRRLTPVECERLQGFPDSWTCLCEADPCRCPDSPRYRALGNAVTVSVAEWLGRRLRAQDMIP